MADIKGPSIRITADTSEFDKELQGAIKGINSLSLQADKLAKSLGVELSSAMAKDVDKLSLLQSHLTKVGAPAADLEKVTLKLTDAQKKLADSISQGASGLGKFGDFARTAGPAIAGVLGGMGAAVVAFGSKAVEEFSKSQVVAAQLEAVLRSTGGAAGVTKQDVENLSTSLSKLTGIDDEALTSAQSLLLTFTSVGKDIFPTATKAIVDMATAMNGGMIPSAEQLRNTTLQVGKALQDPIAGLTALKRAGVNFSESQKIVIKDLVETGHAAEAQKMILAELNKEFGKSSDLLGTTFSGAMGKARTELDNFYESAGGKITPMLASWMTAFPNAAMAVIALKDGVGGLNITTGDLLIALPTLKAGFGGLVSGAQAAGAAFLAMGATAAVATAGFTALAAVIGYFALQWRTAVANWEDSNKVLDSTTSKLNERLAAVGKNVDRGTLSWEEWTKKVNQAAQENAGLINKLGEQERAQAKAKKATDDAIVSAAKHKEELKKQAEAAAKAAKEIQGWGSAIGVTIPKLRENVAEGEKYVAYLKKSGASAQEVKEAEEKLREAKLRLTEALYPEIQAFKDLDKAMISNNETALVALHRNEGLQKMLGVDMPAALEQMPPYIQNVEAAYKNLGLTSEAVLRQQVEQAQYDYKAISESATASVRDIEVAWVAMRTKEIDLARKTGQVVSDEEVKAVETMKAKWGELGDKTKSVFDQMAEVGKRQVSTIVTDLSKGFADLLFAAGDFGSKIVGIFKQIGEAIVRAWIESGVMGLISGKGFSGFSGFLSGITSGITGKGGGAAGTAGNLLGLGGALGIGGKTGLIGGAAGLLGLGGASLAFGGASLAGLGGAGLSSFMLAPATVGAVGFGGATGGGAIAGSGLAAGGTSGGFMSSMGAFFTNPITAIVAGAIVSGLLGYKFAKGKDSFTAGAMEVARDFGGVEFGKNMMKDFFSSIGLSESQAYGVRKEVESSPKFLAEVLGPLAEQQGKIPQLIAALTSGYSAAYAAAFQKGMSTGDWADLNKEYTIWESHFTALGKIMPDWATKLAMATDATKKNAEATAEAAAKSAELANTFSGLADQFLQTGAMSNEFKDQILAAGGSVEAFSLASGAIQNLQGLRGEFSDLKKSIDALLPPVKTWQQEFLETGVITDALAEKIRKAGGNIEDFTKFADTRKAKADWAVMSEEFNKTGVLTDSMLASMEEFAPGFAAGIRKLMDTAAASGKTLGDLAKDSDFVAKYIKDAFDAVGTGVDKQMTDAAQTLSGTLADMDENLSKAIDKLQQALVTMIKDLIDVLLEVPGAAEKAAKDANFFLNGIKDKDVNVNMVLNALTPEEIAAINEMFSTRSGQEPGRITTRETVNTGGATTVYTGGSRTSTIPRARFADGGLVTEPTLALLGEAGAEWVIPNRVLSSFARADSGGSTRAGALSQSKAAPQVNQQITLVNPPDPWAVKKLMDRVNDNLILALSQ